MVTHRAPYLTNHKNPENLWKTKSRSFTCGYMVLKNTICKILNYDLREYSLKSDFHASRNGIIQK